MSLRHPYNSGSKNSSTPNQGGFASSSSCTGEEVGIFCSGGWSPSTAKRRTVTGDRTHEHRGGRGMTKRSGMAMVMSLSVIASLLVLAGSAAAYSGGPQIQVTDM